MSGVTTGFRVGAGWRILFREVGVDPDALLRRAGLAPESLPEEGALLGQRSYFALWRALSEEPDPMLPIRLIQAYRPEFFEPPFFAALCSANLDAALERIRLFKHTVAPTRLTLRASASDLSLSLTWPNDSQDPAPTAYVLGELAFFVELARTATRTPVRPRRLELVRPPAAHPGITAYFGVPPRRGAENRVVFSRADAERPFLTANDAMLSMLEAQLSVAVSMGSSETERVRRALLEALPAGRASVDEVAARLGTSRRTLQRRLDAEGTTYSAVRDGVRLELGQRYLRATTLTHAEIALLLGYADPNSFFRAYARWSGETPEQTRRGAR
ncbi:MAG: AraC family transcriptional regulator ligand-binding domain-containing protein [Myxococcota bacterium]